MSEETLQSSNHPAEPTASKASEATTSDCCPHAAADVPGAADDDVLASTADNPLGDHLSHAPPIPGWLVNVLGHALAGVLGLLLGYLILRWFRPDALPW
jgi:hypothetical protein